MLENRLDECSVSIEEPRDRVRINIIKLNGNDVLHSFHRTSVRVFRIHVWRFFYIFLALYVHSTLFLFLNSNFILFDV